jgi:anti-anti-sigma factor
VAEKTLARHDMIRNQDAVDSPQLAYQLRGVIGGVLRPCPRSVSVVSVEDPLRFPVNRELRRKVRALLRLGERRLVLDLTQVSWIDAAGIGELVRAYNMTAASDGVLRVAHATARVSQILERVGLLDVLTGRPLGGVRCSPKYFSLR